MKKLMVLGLMMFITLLFTGCSAMKLCHIYTLDNMAK